MHVGIVVGTNRNTGLSHHLGRSLCEIYAELGASVDCIDLREMPTSFLAPDAYKSPAPEVSRLVQRFMDCDAVLFIVPEYNGSYPGALKLYIDMFPYPQGFERRPCAYVGLAAGQFQGLRAVEHLEQVAGYRNAANFARRVFIGNSYKQFEGDGSLRDADLDARLRRQAGEFLAFARTMQELGGPAKSV